MEGPNSLTGISTTIQTFAKSTLNNCTFCINNTKLTILTEEKLLEKARFFMI